MTEGFYVTIRRGKRTAWLAGPFATHDEALAMVQPAGREAEKIDPWIHFDEIGTVFIRRADPLPCGKLNAILGVGSERRAAA